MRRYYAVAAAFISMSIGSGHIRQSAGAKAAPVAFHDNRKTFSGLEIAKIQSLLEQTRQRRAHHIGALNANGDLLVELSLERQLDLASHVLASVTISHGQPVPDGTFPFTVAILLKNSLPVPDRQICGGSVIALHWVLTAAHCLDYVQTSDIEVYAGSVDLNSTTVTPIAAVALFKSPLYTTSANQSQPPPNDIGLIQLATPLSVTPASVPDPTIGSLGGASGTIAGWGYTENETRSSTLRSASVVIGDQSTCSQAYPGIVPASMLCAGKTADSCPFDSGGPLFSKVGQSIMIEGITSWGDEDCTQLNQYGVYTRVSAFKSWIVSLAH